MDNKIKAVEAIRNEARKVLDNISRSRHRLRFVKVAEHLTSEAAEEVAIDAILEYASQRESSKTTFTKEFIEWVGDNYVKLHGCYIHRFNSQLIEENQKSLEQLLSQLQAKGLKDWDTSFAEITVGELTFKNHSTSNTASIKTKDGDEMYFDWSDIDSLCEIISRLQNGHDAKGLEVSKDSTVSDGDEYAKLVFAQDIADTLNDYIDRNEVSFIPLQSGSFDAICRESAKKIVKRLSPLEEKLSTPTQEGELQALPSDKCSHSYNKSAAIKGILVCGKCGKYKPEGM
jgi:uncharacterized protein (UPF0216 family)